MRNQETYLQEPAAKGSHLALSLNKAKNQPFDLTNPFKIDTRDKKFPKWPFSLTVTISKKILLMFWFSKTQKKTKFKAPDLLSNPKMWNKSGS